MCFWLCVHVFECILFARLLLLRCLFYAFLTFLSASPHLPSTTSHDHFPAFTSFIVSRSRVAHPPTPSPPVKPWLISYTCLPLVIQWGMWGIWCCQVVLSWRFLNAETPPRLLQTWQLWPGALPGRTGVTKRGKCCIEREVRRGKVEWETVKGGRTKVCRMAAVPNVG